MSPPSLTPLSLRFSAIERLTGKMDPPNQSVKRCPGQSPSKWSHPEAGAVHQNRCLEQWTNSLWMARPFCILYTIESDLELYLQPLHLVKGRLSSGGRAGWLLTRRLLVRSLALPGWVCPWAWLPLTLASCVVDQWLRIKLSAECPTCKWAEWMDPSTQCACKHHSVWLPVPTWLKEESLSEQLSLNRPSDVPGTFSLSVSSFLSWSSSNLLMSDSTTRLMVFFRVCIICLYLVKSRWSCYHVV